MKCLSAALLATTAVIAPVHMASADGFYAGVRGGILSPLTSVRDQDSDTWEHTFDSSFSGGFFIGNYLGSGFRGELAVDVLNFDGGFATDGPIGVGETMTGDARSVAFTASLWRDLPGIGSLTPYIGLGAGLARTESEYLRPTNNLYVGDDWSAVGLAGAGVRVGVTDRLTLDLGYRFTSVINARDIQVLPTFADQDHGNGNYTSHQLSAGLAYRFGGPETPLQSMPSLYGPFYLGGFFGSAWTADSNVGVDMGGLGETVFSNPNSSFGILAGAPIAPSMRGEIELSFLRSEADRARNNNPVDPDLPYAGRFDQTFALVNVWQDFDHGPFSTYIGGGLGFAHVDFDVDAIHGVHFFDGSHGVFAGQFGAGLRYQAKPGLTIDIGYRVRGAFGVVLPNALSDNNARVSLYSHALQASATYAFGSPDEARDAVLSDNGSYLSAALGTAFHPVGEMFINQNHPLFFDPPVSVSLAYGHRVTDNLRAEVELNAMLFDGGYTRDDAADQPAFPIDGGVTQLSVMTNYWADFDLGFVQPYAGGGLGLALVSTDFQFMNEFGDLTVLQEDFAPALALQVGAGVRAPVSDNMLIDVGYRYRTAIDAFSSAIRNDLVPDRQPATITYESHGVQAALVWEIPH